MAKSHKNQHYVPVFYFNQFTDGAKIIQVLLKESGEIHENVSINSQCSEKYFFGDSDLEATYSKIETKISILFKAILKDQKLPTNYSQNLLLRLAAAFQYHRTQKQRLQLSEKMDLMARSTLEDIMRREIETGKYGSLLKDNVDKIKIETIDRNIHLDFLGEFVLGGALLIDLDVKLLINNT